jgi:predicted DCC family thiol-disulfide oxidoreductase YuxK
MIVLYDRDCGFCAWMLAWVLRWDRRRRLRPAPIQGPEGAAWLAHMPPEQRLASWHAVDEDGRVISAGAALTHLLRRLPGGSIPARLTELMPGVTERAYAWVAANRSTLVRPVRPGSKERAWALIAERAGRPLEQIGPTRPPAACALP